MRGAERSIPTTSDNVVTTTSSWRAALLLAIRLGAVVVVSVAMWLVLRAVTGVGAFPPATTWATLGLLPVNVLCLLLVRRLYCREGLSLADALGFRRDRLGRDVLWGLLWTVVMYVPFAAAVSGTVFALYGSGAPAAFATIFVDPASSVSMSPVVLLIVSLLAVVPFMLLNAPTEELVFRGYALEKIAALWGGAVAVVGTSLAFGAQHVLFAATVPGMLVFFVAFTVWGLCAALIVRRQGRLFPVVIAHWIVNVLLASPGIVFPVLQLAGVVPAF